VESIASTIAGLTLGKLFKIICILSLIRFWYLIIIKRYPLITAFKFTLITFVASLTYYEPIVWNLNAFRAIPEYCEPYAGLMEDNIALKFDPPDDFLERVVIETNFVFDLILKELNQEIGFGTSIGNIAGFIKNILSPIINPIIASPIGQAIFDVGSLRKMAWVLDCGIGIQNLLTYYLFGYLVRVKQDTLPYFFRWHLMHSLMIKAAEPWFVLNIISNGPMMVRRMNARYDELGLIIVETILVGVTTMVLSMLIWGMLHAAIGQYYFFPIITETAELHVSRRPKNTPYAGGYASWQKIDYKKRSKWHWWWGIFGKDKEDAENERKQRKKKKKKKPKK